MNIHSLAYELNSESKNYRIGKLQEYRKVIKSLGHKPTNDIFSDKSISNDGWAFHTGGLGELQFNIAFEGDTFFRYGLAFSLQPNRSIPDVSILYPRIRKLNYFIRDNPELFSSYKLWYFFNSNRSQTFPMTEIPVDWIQPGYFIFFGKHISVTEINKQDILQTFDDMLDIYLEIESNDKQLTINTTVANDNVFVFNADKQNFVLNRPYSTVERETTVEIRHSLIQQKLVTQLETQYGINNVGIENYLNGGKIDVVVKNKDKYIFYEVKTGNTARSCIRQALGQLMDYAYWPGIEFAKEIIIVGEPNLDTKTKKYISFLSERFLLPISYKSIKID